MLISDFRGCCNAVIVHGFGESRIDISNMSGINNPTEKEIVSYLNSRLKTIKGAGNALITAITNDEQHVANSFLEKNGWHGSQWYSKDHHSETKIKLWWIGVEEVKDEGFHCHS